jgi:hypothetical protein
MTPDFSMARNEMRRLLSIFAVCLFFFTGPAFAEAKHTQDTEGFEPVASDMLQRGESIPASRLVAAAYGFIFVAVTVWVGSVAARARRVEEELMALRKKIDPKI